MAKLYFSVLTIGMLTIMFVMISVTQLHTNWSNFSDQITELSDLPAGYYT